MVAVVMIAESNSSASHEQEFGIEHPRGYVLGERLVLYQGRDFDSLRIALEFFPDVTEVGFGAKPAEVGQV